MENEKKISLDEVKGLLEEEQDGNSQFTFRNIFAMLVLHWNWFLLSLIICVCGALIYLRYATPVYQMSAKMLIKDEDTRRRNPNQMLANMQEFGFMTNSAGIENEMEILSSRILARDAVKDLKLYTQYSSAGRLKKQIIYKVQPVSVDLDSVTLDQWDREMLEGVKSIKLSITRRGKQYQVQGEALLNGKTVSGFSQEVASLPASVKTDNGVLTLMQALPVEEGESGGSEN